MTKWEFKGYYFIVVSGKIVKTLGGFISLGSNAMSITLFPFIFIRRDQRNNKELLRHEIIHIRQQIELLIVGAIFLFITEYLYGRYIKKLDSRQSYYFTAMEQEAHRNAMNENYLKSRKPYAIVKYIFNKKQLSRDLNDNLIVKDF